MGREDTIGRQRLPRASPKSKGFSQASTGSSQEKLEGVGEGSVSSNAYHYPGARANTVEAGNTRMNHDELCFGGQGPQPTANYPRAIPHFSSAGVQDDITMQNLDASLPEQKRNNGKARKAARLRSRHRDMTVIKAETTTMREELQKEYELMNGELDDVRDSQQQMMNFLKEMALLPQNEGRHPLLELWEQAKSDAQTFVERYARIRQLENALIMPEAQLTVAEEEFVEAANRMVAPKSRRQNQVTGQLDADKRQQDKGNTFGAKHEGDALPVVQDTAMTDQPVTPSNHSNGSLPGKQTLEESLDGAHPLVARLINRKTELRFYKERLNELDWEEDEERFARDLLIDRGDEPSITETEFEENYRSWRSKLEGDVEAAKDEINRLEEVCRAQGIDTMAPHKPPSSMGYKSESDNRDNGGLVPATSASALSNTRMQLENVDEIRHLGQQPSDESLIGRVRSTDELKRLDHWVQSSATVDQGLPFYESQPEPVLDTPSPSRAENPDSWHTEPH